jgi:hypothetical protein
MKQKFAKIFPLMLAGALQLMPLARQALPALAQAGNSPAWVIVLKLAAGAVALFGYHTVSAASSIAIAPTNATVGVKFNGFVQYTGGHSASVQSWQLRTNWLGATTNCGSPYQIAPGIFLTNAATALVQVGGTPAQAGTFSFTMKIWSATSCSGGDSDVRTASITIAAGSSAPIFTAPPANQLVTVGSNATFTATAFGAPAPGYFWQSNGVNIAGANSSTLILTNPQLNFAATYRVFATNSLGTASNSATLAVVAPLANQTNISGSTATFTLVGNCPSPLTYQWLSNSVSIVGQTNATFSLTNVQATNAGTYSIIVSNAPAAATFSAILKVGIPANFSSGLTDITTNAGANVVFSKVANGTAPITYQWYLNGVLRSTGSSMFLSDVDVPNSGSVIQIATNLYGSATNFATLTVFTVPPIIISQPTSLLVPQPSDPAFTVLASGGALAYQWRFNTSTPVGANAATLALNNAVPTDSGFYTVVITNASGAVTSAPAQLLVVPPPAATNAPALTLPPSANGQFTLTFPLEPGFRYLIQGSDDLNSTNWLTLTNLPPSFSGSTFNFTDTSTNALRFYRAVVQQQ